MEFLYKIRYAETDQMGVVHHANYLLYLEQARIEWLEKKGINYSNLEQDGIMLPVYKIEIDYKKPLVFGGNVKVQVECSKSPDVKIGFDYKLLNGADEIVATAKVILVFMSAQTRRPIRCPKYLFEILTS
ncbi:acyl-CoA thioesterase [Flavobacteriaceae bacterium 14752]|uniref:acyl-CoA thioesterase n=1 Tax=Mesohalobacter salilacus TaxID=2491711 RepID=UPI000F633C72|nr:acyl-CoA thioesterase [Flavobacteriaceae bacterium 14752]